MSRRREIRAGNAWVELGLRDRLERGLRAAQARMRRFGQSLTAIGTRLMAVGAAVTAPLVGAITQFMRAGDELDKLAARTRIPVDMLRRLGFAAGQSGADLNSLGDATFRAGRRIARAAHDGTGPAAAAIERLGLEARELSRLAPHAQLLAIADAMARMNDPALAAQQGFEIFGDNVKGLLPLLMQGGDGIEALMQKADEAGIRFTQEMAQGAAQLTDVLDVLWQQIKQVGIEIGAALIDDAIAAARTISNLMTAVLDVVRANADLARVAMAIGGALIVAGAAFVTAGLAAQLLAFAIGGVATAMAVAAKVLAVTIAVITSPIGVAVGLVAGLTAAWFAFSQTGQKVAADLRSSFGGLLGFVGQVVGGIRDALAQGEFQLAGRIAVAGLRVAFLEGAAGIAEAFGGVLGDTIGTVAAKLADGDLLGAWHSVMASMAGLWDGFIVGLKKAFSGAVGFIVEQWNNAVSAISDFLLEDARRGGILGRIAMAGTGIDLQKDFEEEIRAHARLSEALSEARQAKEDLLAAGDFEAADEMQRRIEHVEKQLKDRRLAIPIDFEPGAVERGLLAIDEIEKAITGDGTAEVEGGLDDLRQAAKDARADLNELLQELSELDRKEVTMRFDAEDLDVDSLGDTIEQAAGEATLATFSAEVAGRFAMGIAPDPTEKDIKRSADALEDMAHLFESWDTIVKEGFTFG